MSYPVQGQDLFHVIPCLSVGSSNGIIKMMYDKPERMTTLLILHAGVYSMKCIYDMFL